MIRNLIVIVALLFCSCKSAQNVGGVYNKKGKDFKYELELNVTDSSFVLSEWFFSDGRSTSQGKWYYSTDTILLKCNDEKFSAQISSGYMNGREKKVVVINKNKLKLDNTILKRKKIEK